MSMAKDHLWKQTDWWRFDAYREGDGGTHIVPASDQLHRYNPMRQWEKGWGSHRKEWQPPYIELARLDLDDPWDMAGGPTLLQ